MSLRYKMLLALTAVVAGYTAISIGIGRFVIMPSFVALEREEATKDVARCVDAIRREAHHLSKLCGDWAQWDDTYQFIQDPSAVYIDSNLTWETLEGAAGINLLYFYDPAGRVVWGEAYDSDKGGQIAVKEFADDSLEEDSPLLQHESPGSEHTGIVLTGHGPMLISSRPILTSSAAGPSKGVALMGRFLDEDTLTTLLKQTQVDFVIKDTLHGKLDGRDRAVLSRLSHDTYELEEVSADSLLAYAVLPDLHGNPALLVTANISRTITARGIVAARFAILSTLAATSILLIAIYWQIQRLVLSRVAGISQRVSEIERSGKLSIRVPQAGRDELGKLGENLNNMLARAQSSERALRTANVELEAQKQQLVTKQVELTAMNEELEEARILANEANRTKSEFLANMSHEIRTPMTAILGFADVLVDHGHLEAASTEMIEAVDTIRRNGEYLVQIINDILDLSKIEADKTAVERIACSPFEIIGEVISLVGVRASEKNLPLDVEYIGAVPESIRTDPTRLRQVLINLISNAIKFTETGSVRLLVRHAHNDNGPVLQFDVVDTGIGMTEEQVSKLFQPFVQADGSVTRKFGGTGLGLTISQRLTRLLGGDAAVVETQLGIGTRVRASVATGPPE